ncbi:YfjI family protein [Burkholderia glumae]
MQVITSGNSLNFQRDMKDFNSIEAQSISESMLDPQEPSASFPDCEVATDFPLNALPESIRAAVLEICNRDKIAAPIAVQATLAAVSVACQDLVMVDRGFGEASVCSLFMLVVAESGARKTRADKAVTPIIEDYDRRAKTEYEKKKEAYELELKERQDTERGLQRAQSTLMRNVYSTSEDKIRDAEAALIQVRQELYEVRSAPFKNPKPKYRRMLYSAISIRELERGLCENWPAAGLIANEAADFLNTRSDSDMARLDRLWDGQKIDVVGRTPRESFSVSDPRLTISLMIQPSVFDNFLEKKGERAKGIGFIPRMLIARPDTAYGTRMSDVMKSRSNVWIEKFNLRVKDLLDAGDLDVEARSRNRICLRFSAAAQRRWENENNEKEWGMADGGRYEYEREFVNRYSEHVARVAALFHFFTNAEVGEGSQDEEAVKVALEIDERTLADAIVVVDWYLGEFSRIFNPGQSIKEAAVYVYKKLLERVAVSNGDRVPDFGAKNDENIKIRSNELRGYCHRYGLKSNVMLYDAVLKWLSDRVIIQRRSEKIGSSAKGTEFVSIVLNPPDHAYRMIDDGSLDMFMQILKSAQAR